MILFNKFNILVFLYLALILSISSCRTTQDNDTKLSAVSDKDYKHSLVKSASLSSEITDDITDSAQHNRHFFEFVVCSTKDKTNCVNAFKTEDNNHLAFNIIDVDFLQSHTSLTDSEYAQIKLYLKIAGIVSDIKNAHLLEFGTTSATGIGIGATTAMVINNLNLYNVDVLDSRMSASSKISQLNDILFVTKQLKFKSINSTDSKVLSALKKSYINSLELSELFLNRDSDFAKIFKEVANDKNLKTQSDEVVELFSKKSFEVDQMFLSKIQTKLTTMQSSASSLASSMDAKSKAISKYYLKLVDNLENLKKSIAQATNKDGKVNTKQIFAALSDYYGKTINNNRQLVTSIHSKLDNEFVVPFKKVIISAKKTIEQAKITLAHHADVLNKWYSKPLFHGSKLDSLGRKIDDVAMKFTPAIKTIGNKANDVAIGIKKAGQSATDNISYQAVKLAKKKLAKPLMVIVGTALAGGVVFSGVKLTTQSDATSQQKADESRQADSSAKFDHAQFFKHLHHTFTIDDSVNLKIDSVDQFIDNFAKFLNTNVFLRAGENAITIKSVCFPNILGQKQHSCRTISS